MDPLHRPVTPAAPSGSRISDLAAKRDGSLGGSGPAGSPAAETAPVKCLELVEGTCLGFALELLDGTMQAFAYHYYRSAVLSPKWDLLVLELLDYKVTIRGARLRDIFHALRRGQDVVIRAVDGKYAKTIESTRPFVSEIEILKVDPEGAPPEGVPPEVDDDPGDGPAQPD
jgi:hypothetical protein